MSLPLSPRVGHCLATGLAAGTILAATLLSTGGSLLQAADIRVVFDIPDKIECRDVTPESCAAAHPNLKVIEAKFRISASFVQGSEDSIVDFDYVITSPELRMKIHDYLPNTTLESTLDDDRIEVADTTENSTTNSGEAHVAYKVLNLAATQSKTAKKTEADHYKRIVPKSLVLASGTTNREHGVFFKLRPSKGASLEGGKEFTFLAIVPKAWRGDWCTTVCAARAAKKSVLSTNTTLAGIEVAHVGLYLTGDREAADQAEKLCRIQEADGGLLSKQLAKEAAQALESMHATSKAHHAPLNADQWVTTLIKFKPSSAAADRQLMTARKSIQEIQDHLSSLSGLNE